MKTLSRNNEVDYVDFSYYEMPVADRRKLDIGDIFLNQGMCTECNWIVRSQNRHHVDTCRCKKVSIDGGSWYQKVSGTESFKDLSLSFKYLTEDDEDDE